MADMDNLSPELDLAQQQALKYGKDLAQIYLAEKSRREKLEVAYQALNAIFSSIPDGLVVLDDALSIQQANTAFSRLVEMDPDTILGKPVDHVLLSDQIRPAMQRLVQEEAGTSELELVVTKPVKRSLIVSFARLQAGQLRGWVLAVHDQSALKRLERQKADFINIASHELRTPLASIIGYSDLLLADSRNATSTSNPAHTEFLEAIVRGGRRLTAIVKELIEFAELNQGEIEQLGIAEFSVWDLLEEVVAENLQLAKSRQLNLQFGSDAPNSRMVADRSLLRVALQQLVLNAIHFNWPNGFIRVHAAQLGELVSIEVADSGIGIPQTDLDAIFEPFFQLQGYETRLVDGLGLGLSITRRGIAELGGEIFVVSTLGEGSVFSLKLPVHQPTPDSGLSEVQAQLDSANQQSLVYAQDMQKLYRQLQQAHRELQQVNVQIQEANKLKSNFLGVVSHELRSPFASIDFALQLFPRYGTENLTLEQRELLEQLTGNVAGARKMIDNLIAYASLLSKQGRLNLEVIDISALIRDSVASLTPMAQRRGLDFQVQTSEALTLPAGDRERIGEALWHLVQNAIKFTPSGGEIVVRTRSEPECLTLEVKDTGVGIPHEKQAQVWESFAQLSDPLKRGVEGLGLGLALVRYVAAAHGGDVILESEPGVGTRVGFWLPIKPLKD